MKRRLGITIAGVVILAVAVGVAGYLVGSSRAPTPQDAVRARSEAHRSSFARALATAHDAARQRGLAAGRATGVKSGTAVGSSRGGAAGSDAANAQVLAAQRARNCNAPLFAPGSCPTDAQVAYENQAENLCGSGTAAGREQAARLGIQC
jgi:hypothetical protein